MTNIDETSQPVISAHPVILSGRSEHSIRSRAWMLATFETEERNVKAPGKIKYDLRCDDRTKEEHGSKWHAHMLLYYSSQISFNTIKKAFPKAHIEKAHNVYDCVRYIKDNNNGRKSIYREEGQEPKDTRFKTVQELKDCDDPDDLDWKQYNTWAKIHANDEIDIDDWNKEVEVIWIYHPQSGAGKTERAKQIVRDKKLKYGSKVSIVKHTGEFWHGVGSKRKIAIYDDFRDSHLSASEFINFIDYNRHSLNTKGGSVMNDYQLIIITSIQSPSDIYSGVKGEPRAQWLRRINLIDLMEERGEY